MTDYNIFHHIYWDTRVALDLTLGCVGVGAFILAVLTALFFKKNTSIIKTAAIAAPVSYGLGLLFLFSEIGRPFKMYLTFLEIIPTSPISWGGILQGAFMFLAISYAVLWFFNKGNNILCNLLGIIGIPLALALSFYHGYLLYVIETRAMWHNIYVIAAGVICPAYVGTAAVWLLGLKGVIVRNLKFDLLKESSSAKFILILGLILQLINVLAWNFSGKFLNLPLALLFWIGTIFLGTIAPLYVLLAKKQSFKILAIDLAKPEILASVILIGGFLLRYVILISGQIY